MHEEKCILNTFCKISRTDKCNNLCPHYIGIHGLSGDGGRVKNSGMPKDYQLTVLNNSKVRTTQETAYKTIDTYVKTFPRQFEEHSKRIKSLFLFSESPGTGKTTTACAILNEWIVAHYLGSRARNIQPLQTPGYFLDVNEWQTLFNEFNRSNVPKDIAEPASREYYRRMAAAKTTPFVVCDDIGLRTATEAFRADLHSVINYRTTNALPTVFTSNLPIEEMAKVFDERLYDRMRDMCAVIHFEGRSHRGKR